MIDTPEQSITTLPESVAERMREILARHANDYKQDLPRLIERMQGYARNVNDPDHWRESVPMLKREAHDMKGQAATFGFPSLSAVSQSLCRLLDNGASDASDYAPTVLAHVEALSTLLNADDPALVKSVINRAEALIG